MAKETFLGTKTLPYVFPKSVTFIFIADCPKFCTEGSPNGVLLLNLLALNLLNSPTSDAAKLTTLELLSANSNASSIFLIFSSCFGLYFFIKPVILEPKSELGRET